VNDWPNGDHGSAQAGPQGDVSAGAGAGAGAFDANAHREASLHGWEAAAAGWRRRAQEIRRISAPVSAWMLDAIAPQPGQRVLELAAGLAETGLLAAELVAPSGGVIVSDQAEAMLAGARERARELRIDNVEFKAFSAEWIDLPLASVDAVLCRWGYMLLADPSAALAETRRVLRAGGRVALAVWDAAQRNPWALLPALELIERGLIPPPGAGGTWQPGPFALGDPERVGELLANAGFTEIDVRALDLTQRYDTVEDFWETTLDISQTLHDAILSQPEPEIAAIRAGVSERLRPFTGDDGAVELPARTLVASASA
jgi:SAM-dependent methyltransferase